MYLYHRVIYCVAGVRDKCVTLRVIRMIPFERQSHPNTIQFLGFRIVTAYCVVPTDLLNYLLGPMDDLATQEFVPSGQMDGYTDRWAMRELVPSFLAYGQLGF